MIHLAIPNTTIIATERIGLIFERAVYLQIKINKFSDFTAKEQEKSMMAVLTKFQHICERKMLTYNNLVQIRALGTQYAGMVLPFSIKKYDDKMMEKEQFHERIP